MVGSTTTQFVFTKLNYNIMKFKALVICFIITVLIFVAAMAFIYYWVGKAAYNAFKTEQADQRAYLHIDDSIKTAQFIQRKECREKRFSYQQSHK